MSSVEGGNKSQKWWRRVEGGSRVEGGRGGSRNSILR